MERMEYINNDKLSVMYRDDKVMYIKDINGYNLSTGIGIGSSRSDILGQYPDTSMLYDINEEDYHRKGQELPEDFITLDFHIDDDRVEFIILMISSL